MKSRFILSNGRDSEEKAQRSSCYKTRLAILTPPFTGRATPSQEGLGRSAEPGRGWDYISQDAVRGGSLGT